MAGRLSFNPFYVLLVIVGIAFAITACAYGVMTFTELRMSSSAGQRGVLIEFMESYGAVTLAGELAALAIATVGAIATDRFWQRRPTRTAQQPHLQHVHGSQSRS